MGKQSNWETGMFDELENEEEQNYSIAWDELVASDED